MLLLQNLEGLQIESLKGLLKELRGRSRTFGGARKVEGYQIQFCSLFVSLNRRV